MSIDKYTEEIEKIFLREGFDKFSMEWLAKELGTTKRTLYNNFESREDLLTSMIDLRKEKVKNETLPKFSEYGKNAIDIFREWVKYNMSTLKEFNEVFLPSLVHKFPEYYEYFMHSLQQNCREFLALLIPRGRDEGLLSRNFNIESYASLVLNELTGEWNKEINYLEISNFLVRAICTEQGLKRTESTTSLVINK